MPSFARFNIPFIDTFANNINNTPTTINKIFRIFVKPKLASGKEDKAFRGEAVLDAPLDVYKRQPL